MIFQPSTQASQSTGPRRCEWRWSLCWHRCCKTVKVDGQWLRDAILTDIGHIFISIFLHLVMLTLLQVKKMHCVYVYQSINQTMQPSSQVCHMFHGVDWWSNELCNIDQYPKSTGLGDTWQCVQDVRKRCEAKRKAGEEEETRAPRKQSLKRSWGC